MEKRFEFARFDIVSDDSDHHFLDSNNGKWFNDSKVYSRIMRDWRILEQNLPESIYVRVYERRIDLMRAVIVGAAGTPYHDGLFFFDIRFPSDYPKHPPELHYHSFGIRLNPNLYPDGQVCLSLLNTWYGKQREKWDPSQSTILQVLLSIQALVLNDKPFFNAPDTAFLARFFDYETNSRAYNENAFILTCFTSFHLLRNLPLNFEPFVAAHFRHRAVAILSACKEYVYGRVNVGYYSSQLPLSSATVQVSQNFKTRMVLFYPRLVQAFRENGSSLRDLAQHLELQIEKKSKNKRSGVFNKIIQKIKQTLGWKKN
ncbi:putative ubiquitin-conjugating enzyme E2 38, partial [Mucuna pruriens]